MDEALILLVDDEKSILRALKRTLYDYPYKISIVSSSREAKAFLLYNSADIIISDYKMPDENGFELLSYVRDNYPEIIRIMLSGYIEKEVILKTMFSCAALTYYPKPWDDEKLISRIIEILEIKRNVKDKKLWEKINSGSFFAVESGFIDKLNQINNKEFSSKEFENFIATNLFLLLRVARLVNSDYFPIKSKFNLSNSIQLLGEETLMTLSRDIADGSISKPSPYSIMPDLFSSYYDSIYSVLNNTSIVEPLNIYYPFVYLYNYLFFKIDEKLYKKRILKMIKNGVSINSSDIVRDVFKVILGLCRLPDQFLENSDQQETSNSASIKTATVLRNLIELFWWSDKKPEKHPFYILPHEMIENIYNDVKTFKRLQL